jgi:hypothetical protein
VLSARTWGETRSVSVNESSNSDFVGSLNPCLSEEGKREFDDMARGEKEVMAKAVVDGRVFGWQALVFFSIFAFNGHCAA